MFQMFQEVEKRICFTTGGICPHREDVVPLCVTEGFCGGKRGPKTGIERQVPVILCSPALAAMCAGSCTRGCARFSTPIQHPMLDLKRHGLTAAVERQEKTCRCVLEEECIRKHTAGVLVQTSPCHIALASMHTKTCSKCPNSSLEQT